MPVKEPMLQRDLLRPLQHHLHHLIKLTTQSVVKQKTYLLAVGTLRGLTSQLLKAENQSSQGTAA